MLHAICPDGDSKIRSWCVSQRRERHVGSAFGVLEHMPWEAAICDVTKIRTLALRNRRAGASPNVLPLSICFCVVFGRNSAQLVLKETSHMRAHTRTSHEPHRVAPHRAYATSGGAGASREPPGSPPWASPAWGKPVCGTSSVRCERNSVKRRSRLGRAMRASGVGPSMMSRVGPRRCGARMGASALP